MPSSRSRADIEAVFGPLADAPRWIVWREELRPGTDKPTKIPYCTKTGRKASSTDPATWTTLGHALERAAIAGYDGIGVVLGDGLGGVDLDACRDPATGELAPWARDIIETFGTYAEVSPSGTGVKLFAFGAPAELPLNTIIMDGPPIKGKRPAIETYVRARWFAVTGDILPGVPEELRDCGELGGPWDRLVARLAEHARRNGRNGRGERKVVAPTGAASISGRLARALEEDERLRELWTRGHDGGTDRSRNDAALATTLAVRGFEDADIEAALRAYPRGQIGQGALRGRDAERQIGRLLGLAADARERRAEDDAPPRLVLPRLPAEFWEARDVLRVIRDAAWSRLRAPDAVFHCVLARIGAFRPPMMRAETGIAAPASLNYFAALIDASGGGKSSAHKVARNLLPPPEGMEDVDGLPLGSGEGIAEAYMGTAMQPREDDPDKMEKVRKQVRHNVLLYGDEGQVLARLSERNGSTLGEALRRAFNGEVLGQTNASQDRIRRVQDYSLGLVIGLQPPAALALLDEADYGTPQRFLYATCTDPSIPDDPPRWPGELRLTLLERFRDLTIDQAICDELRRQDLARQRGELVRDPLDAHEPLLRIKAAACLAILDGRAHVDADDWRLAGVVVDTSRAVRDAVVEYGRALARLRQRAERREHAARAVVADRALARERAAVERVADTLRRAILRATGPLTSRDLHHAIASRDRRYKDRAIAHAVRAGWLARTDDGRWTAGPAATEAA